MKFGKKILAGTGIAALIAAVVGIFHKNKKDS